MPWKGWSRSACIWRHPSWSWRRHRPCPSRPSPEPLSNRPGQGTPRPFTQPSGLRVFVSGLNRCGSVRQKAVPLLRNAEDVVRPTTCPPTEPRSSPASLQSSDTCTIRLESFPYQPLERGRRLRARVGLQPRSLCALSSSASSPRSSHAPTFPLDSASHLRDIEGYPRQKLRRRITPVVPRPHTTPERTDCRGTRETGLQKLTTKQHQIGDELNLGTSHALTASRPFEVPALYC